MIKWLEDLINENPVEFFLIANLLAVGLILLVVN
jgi:hypothetical protein